MASTRVAQLLAQRSSYSTIDRLFGGNKRRVLSPTTSPINTIAKRTLDAEFSAMNKKYADGLISTEDIRSWITKNSNSNLFTPDEKVQMDDILRGLDSQVRSEKLQAIYKTAAPNSMDRVNAANSLAKFYKDQAATMIPGTPAHSTALANAGGWENTVTTEQNQVESKARANYRASIESQVAQIPSNTSEYALAKATEYNKLYQTALNDGDTLEANRFLTQSNAYATQAQTLKQKEDEAVIKEQDKQQKQAINAYAAEQDVVISKMKDNSPAEASAKADKAYNVAEQYRQIGDQINYNHYMAIYNDAKEKFNKLSEGNPKEAINTEVNGLLNEIRDLQSAYKRGDTLQGPDGQQVPADGLTVAQNVAERYQAIIAYLNQAKAAGVKGLDDNIRGFMDKLDVVQTELDKRQLGEIVDVVDSKTGRVVPIDVADPEQAKKYVQGEGGLSYRKLVPTSNVAGKTELGLADYLSLYKEGKAYVARDEFGNAVDIYNQPIIQDANGIWRAAKLDPTTGKPMVDDTGKPMTDLSQVARPHYVPEQYVDIRTPQGVERVWTQHDAVTGEMKGWYSEKAPAGQNKTLMETPYSYQAYQAKQQQAQPPQQPEKMIGPQLNEATPSAVPTTELKVVKPVTPQAPPIPVGQMPTSNLPSITPDQGRAAMVPTVSPSPTYQPLSADTIKLPKLTMPPLTTADLGSNINKLPANSIQLPPSAAPAPLNQVLPQKTQPSISDIGKFLGDAWNKITIPWWKK